MQEYADPVIDWLDAGRGILPHRFFRDVRHISPVEFTLYVHLLIHFLLTVLYPTAKRLVHKRPVSS